PCHRPMTRASEMSSEEAYACLSALTARTPTPQSMLNVPDLTMPSSRLQPSNRACWKYRSAKSMSGEWISARTRDNEEWSRPDGASSSCSASARTESAMGGTDRSFTKGLSRPSSLYSGAEMADFKLGRRQRPDKWRPPADWRPDPGSAHGRGK